ncbi:MAG: hypothetical protein PUC47_03915 [Oscillospiraceae bacterium]|nr:hypothetical protein [Oscillospiraceae bacterium]
MLIELLDHPLRDWHMPLAYGLLYPAPLLVLLCLRKKYGIRRKK